MKEFNTLIKNLKKDFDNLIKIKVALLGDTATQFLARAIRATGYDEGYDFEIWESDFNQIERQIYDNNSDLYQFAPEIIIIFQASHKLLGKYNKLPPEAYASLADNEIKLIKSMCNTITENIPAKIICYNYPEINDSVFGNYANKNSASFLFQLRKLNYEIMLTAAENPGMFIVDLCSIQNEMAKSVLFHPAVYINSEMVLGINALPQVASHTVQVINAFYGKLIKCVILDLDNTTWGGIIGDDGVENIEIGSLGIGKAFSEFQYWIKKLKNRGIIIAVCSKNTESIAKEPFEKHPDMVLKLEDIAVFIANWENKVDNIKKIQSILNIGFDSMVFLDDNPFERNIVRENIHQIIVPELPEDPAEYLEYLYSLNLFETASVSKEDAERTKLYQVEAKRSLEEKAFLNVDEFLESLKMTSVVEPFNKFNIPRVSQLSQRSNQFNLRTVRYSEADLLNLSGREDYYSLSFTLHDKFGDNGLICVIVLKKERDETLFIENWLMSCRVLKRGMEQFVLNEIVALAKSNQFRYLKGEFIQTAKNDLVKDHYASLGFHKKDNYWILETGDYKAKNTFINKKES